MKKVLKNLRNLEKLFSDCGMTGLDFVSMNIGYDGKVYFLFSSKIPDRIDGMFVDTVANAEYSALVVTPSWESGTVEETERLDFGKHRMNFHFIRPVPDGSFLLLGSRCECSKTHGPEKNAVFVDIKGNVLREFTFGDGIADCIVRDDGIIITSYFDEGVFGNYGWKDPIGYSGVCAWTTDGEIIWRADSGIVDCYAVNTDEDGNLWYYFYMPFLLVRTDFKTEKEVNPRIKGADRFAVISNGRFLIMDGGYDDQNSLFVSRITGSRIRNKEKLEFVREDGTAVPAEPKVFCGTKAIVMTEDGEICFADFGKIVWSGYWSEDAEMSENVYRNDSEREETQKYEGIYTPEEIELNKRLYRECSEEDIDFEIVEDLLKQGADPLGGTEPYGWDLLNHVYEELVLDSRESDIDLPKITELFLKYGMDVDNPRIPYDGSDSINPLWSFTFIPNENSIKALKMLLDHGLSAASFAEFWDHSLSDLCNVECGDPENNAHWNHECVWAFKMILLGSSYDHVLSNDSELRYVVCCSYNSNDIHLFRDWDDFEYHFDTSRCPKMPKLLGSIIHIYSKKTGEEVWRIGVGKTAQEALSK